MNQRGRSLIEVSIGLSLIGLVLMAAPSMRGVWGRSAVEGAARQFASLIRIHALEAVVEGTDRALVFPAASSERVVIARDENGNGVSRRDVEDGTDRVMARWTFDLEQPGVRVDLPEWSPPPKRLPPSHQRLTRPAVRFGAARMINLTAAGTATPGSLYVTDGEHALCAVVVHGASARTRIWCYRKEEDSWVRR